jgi:hypothetical protein
MWRLAEKKFRETLHPIQLGGPGTPLAGSPLDGNGTLFCHVPLEPSEASVTRCFCPLAVMFLGMRDWRIG